MLFSGSVISDSSQPHSVACQSSLSFIISQSLLKLMSIESVMSSNHLILCCPLLLLPSTFPSIRVFSNESALWIRWPKYRSFSISPSNEYSGLISFRIDWFDFAIHESSPTPHTIQSISFSCPGFFRVLHSHLLMTTGKTIALNRWIFLGKVMPLLFNTLSRLIIAFLPMNKRLLISWLQSPFAVILEPKGGKKNLSGLLLFPLTFAMKWWVLMPWS